jgi:hypothetical protein
LGGGFRSGVERRLGNTRPIMGLVRVVSFHSLRAILTGSMPELSARGLPLKVALAPAR